MKKVFVVRTAMKKTTKEIFDWFEIFGVFTTLKKAKQAVYSGYKFNKGESISEYQNGETLQINYNLLSTDEVQCNYRALIDEHGLNKNWML